MTAIDQSALGLGVVRNKNAVAQHGGHGHGKDDKDAKTFDDLMSDAEGRFGKASAGEDDAELLGTAPTAEEASGPAGSGTKGRIQISTNFSGALRAANESDRDAMAVAERRLADEKSLDAANAERKAESRKAADARAAEAGRAKTPAEQLSALLGLTPEDAVDGTAAGLPGKKAEKAAEAPERKEVLPSDKPTASAAFDILRDAAVQMQAAAEVAHHAEGRSEPAPAKVDDDRPDADVVRLISKDGKGTPVDVPLADTGEAAETDKSGQPAGKTDFVTVLDSRRYLGFSNDANISTLAGAIKADPTWGQALQAVTSAQSVLEGNTTTAVNTLKLQMNPESLGSMTASLRLKGEELTVEVKVETVEAYRQLSGDHDTIVKALKDQGFNIDQVTIQLSAPEKSSDLGQDRGNQSPNGQDARDSLGQNAKQREENERRTGNQNLWRDNDQTTSSQGNSGNSSGGDGSGDIYL